MALVDRYFSTAAAGAADGTSWANRATFLSSGTSGTLSSVITGFSVAGTDALRCRVGPGTYTLTATPSLSPTAANPLIMHGCDSSGNLLTPPAPGWTSDQPDWDTSGLPIITTTSNIATFTSQYMVLRLLGLTSSARAGDIIQSAAEIDWCLLSNSTSNASASLYATAGDANLSNCLLKLTGTAFAYALSMAGSTSAKNCRISGNASASSGNRHGVSYGGSFGNANSLATFDRLTVIGVPGVGVLSTSTNASEVWTLSNSVIVNCGSDGVRLSATASQSQVHLILNNCITGCGGYGINGQSAGQAHVANNRTRNNALGDTNGLGNWPVVDLYNTAGTDAGDYNNAASGDYRINAAAGFANRGIGVSQMSSGSAPAVYASGRRVA